MAVVGAGFELRNERDMGREGTTKRWQSGGTARAHRRTATSVGSPKSRCAKRDEGAAATRLTEKMKPSNGTRQRRRRRIRCRAPAARRLATLNRSLAFHNRICEFGKYGGERDILLLPCGLDNLNTERAMLWNSTTAARDRSDPWVVELIASTKLARNLRLGRWRCRRPSAPRVIDPALDVDPAAYT
jgi:hypothetical protein